MKQVTFAAPIFELCYIFETLGKSPVPFTVRPMSHEESRFLWNSLRYDIQQDTQLFKPDIPGNWLTDEMHYKEVTKTW